MTNKPKTITVRVKQLALLSKEYSFSEEQLKKSIEEDRELNGHKHTAQEERIFAAGGMAMERFCDDFWGWFDELDIDADYKPMSYSLEEDDFEVEEKKEKPPMSN